jgi:hypothetical protein
MNTTRNWKGLALALGLLLLALPALAGDASTAPPWGENGPEITFGDKGILQFDYLGQFRMTVRDDGSGIDGTDTTTNFGFRRNRVALRGAWGDVMSVYVQTEFIEDLNVTPTGVASANQGLDFQILDAALRFDFKPGFKIQAGKFKYNLSRENLEACEDPLTLDRSLFVRTAYVATRDQGVAIWGNLFKDRFQYRADVMEGRPAVSGVTAPASNPRFSGRAHVSLLDPENRYGYKGTYLGKKKVLTIGGAYQFESDVTYTDVTTQIASRDYEAWTVDGFLEYPFEGKGTATLSGAYENVDLGDAYLGATPDPEAIGLNGQKNGWYGKGAYLLPKTPLQVFGRYERWRFALLNNVYDQLVDFYAVGANYYIWGQSLKLTAEFSGTRFDQEGTFSGPQGSDITSRDFNTFVAQIQLGF